MTYLDSADVFVDLATDSGTAAMSDRQWGAMMVADEAYVRSRSFFRFESAVREILGYRHVIPTHQGRAAENLLTGIMVKPGDVVLSNTHFDTVRAHIETKQGVALDLIGDALWSFDDLHPFKGNFSLEKLRAALKLYG
ncbi:MAG TPA: beta-eliminating lyase-related protein, partial [Polyangiaceae bacterium]|nr:beta-eliminating lyase-related protein [Polyangiaceae bacterium]